MKNEMKLSRLTGIIILVMAGLAVSSMYLTLQLESNQSTFNIPLLHLSALCELLVPLLEIIISVLLFQLFYHANKTCVTISMLARISMTVVQSINVMLHLLALWLLTNDSLLKEWGIEQGSSLISIFIQLHFFGTYVWEMFFGLHLIFLGYVAYKSGYVPKFVGFMNGISSIGYLLHGVVGILNINNNIVGAIVTVFLIISTVGELIFAFWLLVKGVNKN